MHCVIAVSALLQVGWMPGEGKGKGKGEWARKRARARARERAMDDDKITHAQLCMLCHYHPATIPTGEQEGESREDTSKTCVVHAPV